MQTAPLPAFLTQAGEGAERSLGLVHHPVNAAALPASRSTTSRMRTVVARTANRTPKMLEPRGSVAALAAVCIFALFQAPVSAQGSASCSASGTTISNAADATAIASCTTFTGDITLSPSATGTVSLDGVQTLNGNLLVDSVVELKSFSASDLERVNGYVYLTNLSALGSVDFPRLTSIGDQIRMETLPVLSQLQFGATLSDCPMFTLKDTALGTLSGIDPAGTTEGFTITDNENLQGNITMSVTSTRATSNTFITILNNAPGLSASFPNLATAQRIDLYNLSSVSLPQLTETYELVLQDNTFRTFSAPKLQSVGNSTTFGVLLSDNMGLVDVEFPALVRTGGFTLRNNSRLDSVTLDNLQTANDGIDLEGSFSAVSFPDLQNVNKFLLRTTSTSFDCSALQKYNDQNVIKDLTCDTGSKGNSSSPSSSSSGLSTGAKAGIGVGVAVAVIILAAITGFLFYRSRKRSRARSETVANNVQEERHEKAAETPPMYESVAHLPNNWPGGVQEPLMGGKGGSGRKESPSRGPNELEAEPNQVYELQDSSNIAELPGESHHGR